jgi:hypothetical protein
VNHAFRTRLFAHVVDSHGAADAFAALLRTSPRGRKSRSNPRTFLILLLLAAADGELTIEHMHEIATRGLPLDVQRDLGILRSHPSRLPAAQHAGAADAGDDRTGGFMPIDELYYISRVLTKKLAVTGPYAADLNEQEMAQRRDALRDLVDRLLLGTLPDRPGSSYALDESAIWAWARGRKTHRAQPDAPIGHADAGTEDVPPTAPATGPPALSVCPDAAWGTKTGKNGEQDAYFGYALHALVRVPDLQAGPRFSDEDDPVLIEAIALTPASTDVVDVSLHLLDRVRTRRPVVDLLADRHYSYKEWSRWANELWTRGIHPVLDLRENEHGFRPYQGARIAASWPHCPATPTRLADIPRPGLGAPKRARQAFQAAIEERQQYAMRRVKSHVPDGASRWECPARAGKIGCPLVEGTVAVAQQLGMPTVARPPARPHLPTCCTQRTFMIRTTPPVEDDPARTRRAKLQLGQTMKHAQDEYWGSHRWLTSWNRRTYVEGAFGNLKNPNTENVSRGVFRFTGLPLVTLSVAAAVTASNVRQLRNWHQRTGNGTPGHPLLQPEPTFRGFALVGTAGEGTDEGDPSPDLDLPAAA